MSEPHKCPCCDGWGSRYGDASIRSGTTSRAQYEHTNPTVFDLLYPTEAELDAMRLQAEAESEVMTESLFEREMKDPARVRHYLREYLLVDAAEAIARAMEQAGIDVQEMARRTGIQPARMKEILGGVDLNLSDLGLIVGATGYLLNLEITLWDHQGPLSAEAIERSRRQIAAGNYVTLDELKAEFETEVEGA